MKKRTKREQKDVKKEEISEIFEVEKEGKEKTIKTHEVVEKKESPPSKEQIKKENKTLKIVIGMIVFLILLFFGVLWLINYSNHFEVGGVVFEVDKTAMAGKTLYKTSVPGKIDEEGNFVIGNFVTGKVTAADYNFYFRTDPRKLKSIDFSGEMNLKNNMVISMEKNFGCNGDGIIAIANLLNLYEALGISVVKDENASCEDDIYGLYMWADFKESNKTEITKWGTNEGCYNINVNGCDILPATEKFMLETLIEMKKKLNE